MSFLIARPNISLSRATANAWRGVGGVVMGRGHTDQDVLEWVSVYHPNFIINLGRSWSDYDGLSVPALNRGNNILPLMTPAGTRGRFNDLLPPQTIGQVWIKGPGRAGRAKHKVWTDQPLVMPEGWDWQAHIEGQEYRLVTVGNRIVQCFQRFGDNGEREYHWIRMSEVNANLKDTIRMAASRLEGINVVAWDAIVEEEMPYIFEGNTCPGMSPNTAKRIVKEIERQLNE